MRISMKRIDIVIPAYNEEAVIGLFFEKVLSVIDGIKHYAFNLIVVNDGSRDNTLPLLLAARERDPRIEVVDLSRNFGHEAALAAGLHCSTGDAVIVMDADLQDPPELMTDMIAQWEKGFDVVNAHRSSRKEDSFLKRWTAKQFYRTINHMAGKVNIPENVGNYRLLSARVVKLLNDLPEKNRVFRVLIPYLGFATAEVNFVRPKRPAGQTHYNYSSMIRLAIDGITSATIIPLKFAINIGFLIAGGGFFYMLYIIISALVTHDAVQGWPSTMSIILFLGGIQLVFLGIIGEYVGRVFLEIKARPDHVIRERHLSKDSLSTQK